MPFTFLMLPPHSELSRDWGRWLAAALPEARVVVAADERAAAAEIGTAEAAYGVLPRALLAKATRLRWLQSPRRPAITTPS
jgi:hypothetical protein